MAVMLSNRLPFIALAVACVAAAAGGSYVATRQNLTPVAPAAAVALPGTPAQAGKPVQETEAVIGDPRNGQTSSGPAAAAKAPTAPAAPSATAAPSAAPGPRGSDGTPGRAAPGRASRSADTTTARRSNQLPTLERSWPSGT